MEARVVMATAGTVALAVGAQQHPASVKTAGEHVVHNISQRRGACYRRIPQTPHTRTDRLVDPRTAGADTTHNENACYNKLWKSCTCCTNDLRNLCDRPCRRSHHQHIHITHNFIGALHIHNS